MDITLVTNFWIARVKMMFQTGGERAGWSKETINKNLKCCKRIKILVRLSYLFTQFFIADGTKQPLLRQAKSRETLKMRLFYCSGFVSYEWHVVTLFAFVLCSPNIMVFYHCQVQTFENYIKREECEFDMPSYKAVDNVVNDNSRRLHLETHTPPSPSPHWIWILLGLDSTSTAFPISYVVTGLCLLNFLNCCK